MARSPAETYRKLLAEQPGSPVFADLARLLIARGEFAEAAEVCARAAPLQPESIPARVLWGEALLGLGRPAEAMEQFNLAIALDRSNPRSYDQVGDVLLKKGLYRSAVPLLRKAVALQPGDPSALAALHVAERALKLPLTPAATPPPKPPATALPWESAEPAPRRAPAPAPLPEPLAREAEAVEPTISGITGLFESLSLDGAAAAPPASAVERSPEPPEKSPAAFWDDGLVGASAGAAAATPAGAAERSPEPAAMPPAALWNDRPVGAGAGAPAPLAGDTGPAAPTGPLEISLQVSQIVPPERLELPDLATTFPAIPAVSSPPAPARSVPRVPAARPQPQPQPQPVPEPEVKPELKPELMPAEEPASETAPEPIADSGAPAEAALEPEPARGGAPGERETPPAPPPIPPRLGISELRTRLLADLPDHDEPPPAPAAPAPVAPHAAEQIGRDYEQSLRERLLVGERPGFLRRHVVALVVGALIALAAAGAWVVFGVRAHLLRQVELDTPAARQEALRLAKRLDPLFAFDPRLRATAALASALESAGEPGGGPPKIDPAAFQGRHPGFAAVVGYLIAPPERREQAARAVLEGSFDALSGFEAAEVHSLAGRLLLASGRTEDALGRFRRVLELFPRHVPTLLALGEYYLHEGEPEQAASFFDLARAASPNHVLAILGSVRSRLETAGGGEVAGDLNEARAALARPPGWPAEARVALVLAQAQLLARDGKLEEAARLLTADGQPQGARAADAFAALGEIESRAGHFDRAEEALRRALEQRPGEVLLRERLARALLAQGRPADALDAAEGAAADRRLRVVRGLALMDLGQPVRAREELAATARKGKVPTEAAILLATLDAAQGQKAGARKVLESALEKTRADRALAHVALGRLDQADGREKDALAHFTAAQEDPRDWEGACSQGRLHLGAGRLELARPPLEKALQRNRFHVEARLALARLLLAQALPREAQDQLDALLSQAPSAAAHRLQVRALLAQGDLAGARQHLEQAKRLGARDPELPVLARQLALLSGEGPELAAAALRESRASPRDPADQAELGEILLATGDAAGARRAFAAALRLNPGYPRASLGMVACGLPQDARRLLDDADRLARNAPPEMRTRALALAARARAAAGDLPGAEQRARSALGADAGSAEAHLALGLVARARREAGAARDSFARAVVLDPALAEARFELAQALAADPATAAQAPAQLEAGLRIAPRPAEKAPAPRGRR